MPSLLGGVGGEVDTPIGCRAKIDTPIGYWVSDGHSYWLLQFRCLPRHCKVPGMGNMVTADFLDGIYSKHICIYMYKRLKRCQIH